MFFLIISVHAKQLCKVCAYSFDGNVHIFDYSFNGKCTPLNHGELVEKRECLSVKYMLKNICLVR